MYEASEVYEAAEVDAGAEVDEEVSLTKVAEVVTLWRSRILRRNRNLHPRD